MHVCTAFPHFTNLNFWAFKLIVFNVLLCTLSDCSIATHPTMLQTVHHLQRKVFCKFEHLPTEVLRVVNTSISLRFSPPSRLKCCFSKMELFQKQSPECVNLKTPAWYIRMSARGKRSLVSGRLCASLTFFVTVHFKCQYNCINSVVVVINLD